ncbi:MAG: hypothetical protein LKM30_05790 [Bacilli bacterium]|jgi:1-deoxy-D-xylulose-5-phosphate reductoisomerase|nr:hypothetical protein [Bacilli bacterium]
MREPIVVLGATGSIGRQTLDILRFSFDYDLVGVSLNSQFEKLEDYLLYFDHLSYVAIADEEAAKAFKAKHPSYHVLSGKDVSLKLLAKLSKATVFNALMGNSGLLPSLKALRQNQDLLLANKETLVIGSSLIKKELAHSHSHLYPVDSEHVGLAKLIAKTKSLGIRKNQIKKLIVTASGGSLRDFPKDAIDTVTPEQVLHHPTWAMGSKITVDSATLVNKGYEVIEASVLFDMPLEKVGAIICRESLVHAELIYTDHGKEKTLLEYSPCDMKVAISYALSKGKLRMHENTRDDLKAVSKLHFAPIDQAFYPLFGLTQKMYQEFGNYGMIYYNAVDTEAIKEFLNHEIPFSYLREALRFCYENLPQGSLTEEALPQIEEAANRFAVQTLIKVSLFYRGGNLCKC